MTKKIAFIFDIPKRTAKDERIINKFIAPVIKYDIHYLTDNPDLTKVLVKDITLDLEKLKKDYDFIVPVGAEPFKKLVKHKGGVNKYHGVALEEPFKCIPIINPNILYIYPTEEPRIVKAFDTIYRLYKADFSVIKPCKDKHYELVTTKARFEQLVNKWVTDGKMLAYDLETTALEPTIGEIIGAAFSNEVYTGYFVINSVLEASREKLKALLNSLPILMHNAKFDKKWTMIKFGIGIPKFHDTMILHYLLVTQKKGTHSLKLLAMDYTNLKDYSREQDEFVNKFCRQNKILKRDFNFGMIPMDMLYKYACSDVDATLQLMENMGRPAYRKANALSKKCYNEIMLPATDMLMWIEICGAPIDNEYLHELDELFTEEIKSVRSTLSSQKGVQILERKQGDVFNPNSPKQIGTLLFDIMGLPEQGKTPTGNYKTDAETLTYLSGTNKVPELILNLRKATKMKGTYVDNIIELSKPDGRVHGNFNLTVAESGRLSSSQEGDD